MQKQKYKNEMNSHIVLLSIKPKNTSNPALMGQIGCAVWLETKKDNVGCKLFCFPVFAYKSRPKDAFRINVSQCKKCCSEINCFCTKVRNGF